MVAGTEIYGESANQYKRFWESVEVFDRWMPAHAKLVRLCLARCANDSRAAQVTLETVAHMCGLSRASVVRALKWLVDNGWVERLSRSSGYDNLGNTYMLLVPPQEASRKSGERLHENGCGVPEGNFRVCVEIQHRGSIRRWEGMAWPTR